MCRAFHTSLCCFIWRHWCNYTSILQTSSFFSLVICTIPSVERPVNTSILAFHIHSWCSHWEVRFLAVLLKKGKLRHFVRPFSETPLLSCNIWPSSNHPSSASSGSHITLNPERRCVSWGRQDTGLSIMNGITGVMLPLSPLLMNGNEARSMERNIMLQRCCHPHKPH